MDIIEDTQQRIKDSRLHYKEIAELAGNVSESWVNKFMQNKVGDPGIKRLFRIRGVLLCSDTKTAA